MKVLLAILWISFVTIQQESYAGSWSRCFGATFNKWRATKVLCMSQRVLAGAVCSTYTTLPIPAPPEKIIPSAYAPTLPKHDAPIGIRNDCGCCYAISFLQIINVVRHVIPDTFEKVCVKSPHSLLDGYAKTLNNVILWSPTNEKGFALQTHILNPDYFVQPFITTDPIRGQKVVFEEQRLPDGTTKKASIGPWKEVARNADPYDLMKLFFEQWNIACKERNISNPFECIFITPTGRSESYCWTALGELRGASNIDDFNNGIVNFSRLIPPHAHVTQYPQFLIATHLEERPIAPLSTLQIHTHSATDKPISYKALAALYMVPMISHDKGFVGNHMIALVRYGSLFYLCDNERIMPFINAQAALNWAKKASTISYYGPGLPRNACLSIMPRIVIYEQVGV